MCELVAAGSGRATEEVLVCQTGLIGVPFPIGKFELGLQGVGGLRSTVATTQDGRQL